MIRHEKKAARTEPMITGILISLTCGLILAFCLSQLMEHLAW